MPCIALAAPPVPALPPGVTLPAFAPPSLPNLGLCCKLPIPSYPTPNIALTIPFPAAVVKTLNGLLSGLQAYFDALQVTCPLQ